MRIARRAIVGLVGLGCFGACDSPEEDDRTSRILSLSADADAGTSVFQSAGCNIPTCHGSDGNSGTAPRLSATVPAADDSRIVGSLLNGRGTMPSQGRLSDQELADVVAWLNESFT